jgi:type I restriction enzyme S subunit
MVPARQLVALNYGRALKADTRRAGKVPVYGTNGQCGWHDEPLARAPGLILGRKGQGPLGVEWCDKDFWVIDTAYYASTLISELDLKYFYHLVKYVGLNHLKDGTSNPTLSRDTFGAQLLPFPPLTEQKAIAAVLGALDDKIDLNRRMNETLEGLARAIFQSWFVDFDPVRAKRDGVTPHGLAPDTAALFPDSFEDSELGKIPKGWCIETLGDHVDLQRGKTYKSKLKELPGPYLLGLASIGRNGGFRSDKLVTYGGDCPKNLLVYPGDLFVSLKDVTQSADLLGSVARFPSQFKLGRLTQDTVKLSFKDGAPSRNHVYRTLLTPEYRAHCRAHATGTTNLGLARNDFLSYPLIVPPPEIEAVFDKTIDAIEVKIDTNQQMTTRLAAIRDALLPKLLSGEVRVAAAERLVGDAR